MKTKTIKKAVKKVKKVKKVKPIIEPEIKDKLFYLTLSLNGKEYKGEGETFEEALEQIEPKGVRMSGTFRLSYDGKEAKTTLHVNYMRKLFLFHQKIIVKFLIYRLMMCLK